MTLATMSTGASRWAPYNDSEYRTLRRWVQKTRPHCGICGNPGADEVDHIIPIAQGGSHDLENLRPAHRSCNRRRGSADAEMAAVRSAKLVAEIEACPLCDCRGFIEAPSTAPTGTLAPCPHDQKGATA